MAVVINHIDIPKLHDTDIKKKEFLYIWWYVWLMIVSTFVLLFDFGRVEKNVMDTFLTYRNGN